MESSFEVYLPPEVEKTLRRLPQRTEKKLIKALQRLQQSPLPDGRKIKKIKTLHPAHYEYKEGDHRIIFRVEAEKILIKLIVDRKDLEKELRQMR